MSLTNVNIRCEEENAKKSVVCGGSSSLAAARYSFDDFCNTRALLFDDARRQARDDGGSAYALPFFFRYKKMSLFFVPIRAPFLSHFKRIKYRREKTRAHIILLLYSKLDETNTNAERTTTIIIIIALSSKGQKKKKVVVVVVSKGGQKKTTKRRG